MFKPVVPIFEENANDGDGEHPRGISGIRNEDVSKTRTVWKHVLLLSLQSFVKSETL
jgi:hypothetical protein